MNHYLKIDKHNGYKAHHIIIDEDGHAFYNQAIKVDPTADRKSKIPDRKPTVPGHDGWYDFYEAEPVQYEGGHGYQSYIDEAIAEHRAATRTGFLFDTVAEMHEATTAETRTAVRDAKRRIGWKFHRATPELIAIDSDGDRVGDPIYLSDSRPSRKEILQLAEDPDVAKVYFQNGIDVGEHMLAFEWSDYEPKVEYAEVLLYRKAAEA